jgi:hypothetical protein
MNVTPCPDEDIILDRDAFADECVRRDLATASSNGVFLHLDEPSHLGFVADSATIEVDQMWLKILTPSPSITLEEIGMKTILSGRSQTTGGAVRERVRRYIGGPVSVERRDQSNRIHYGMILSASYRVNLHPWGMMRTGQVAAHDLYVRSDRRNLNRAIAELEPGSVYRKRLTTKYISTSANPARNIPAGMDKSVVRIQQGTVIAFDP